MSTPVRVVQWAIIVHPDGGSLSRPGTDNDPPS
jgi:hypothetical protein